MNAYVDNNGLSLSKKKVKKSTFFRSTSKFYEALSKKNLRIAINPHYALTHGTQ